MLGAKTCPPGTNRESGPRLIAPNCRHNGNSPVKCVLPSRTHNEKLWWHLRHRLAIPGTHFRRQVRIGRYIADFACHSKRIVVEVDGSQHAERVVADKERTRVLEANGYRVLRYWNNDVLTNINGVLEDILSAITRPPPPTPPHKGEGSTLSPRQPRRRPTYSRQQQHGARDLAALDVAVSALGVA